MNRRTYGVTYLPGLDIEYNKNPDYKPVSVYLKRGSKSSTAIDDFHGKKLNPLLKQVTERIVEEEKEENNEL